MTVIELAIVLLEVLTARLRSGRIVAESLDPDLRSRSVRAVRDALRDTEPTDAELLRTQRWLAGQLEEANPDGDDAPHSP